MEKNQEKTCLFDKFKFFKNMNKNFYKNSLIFFLIFLYFVFILISFVFPYSFFTSKEFKKKDLVIYHRFLSDDSLEGRYPSTNGSKKAQEWIIYFFKKWNYYSLFDQNYFQEFSFSGKYKKTGINKIELKNCTQNCEVPIEPMNFSLSGQIEGKIIEGNFCVEEKKELTILIQKIQKPEDYIVICKRYGSKEWEKEKDYKNWISFENKYFHIDRLKFKGVIFLKDEGDNLTIEQLKFSKKGKTLAAFFDNEKYKEFYKKILETNSEIKITINYEQEKLIGKNIGFSLKPLKENQKIIYIGAHYDHLGKGIPEFSLDAIGKIYNGADDNASGISGIMELAEYFAYKKIPEDWNLVFLFFDAEEWGLLGAKEFVNSKYFNKNSIAMLNFDMIGRLNQTLQIQGKDTGDKIWSNLIENAADKIQKKYSIKIQWMKGGKGPSDHTEFYQKQIPVLFFFTGTHKDYHKPTDDYDKINYSGIIIILELAKEFILELMHSKELPKYQKAKEENQSFSFKVRLGIIPSNYYSEEGLEVGGFVENAPIAKSGIQIGDIIIQIGDKKIQNIYDLMEFLQTAKLGISYKILYIRNKKIYETYSELMENK